jgi:hypothetical protein
MFLDAQRFDGWPLQEDMPPEVADDYFGGAWGDQMRRFTVNRHNGAVNGLFMNFSVRKIPLKCLWRLKWHRLFDLTSSLPTEFSDPTHWMYKFKDPD